MFLCFSILLGIGETMPTALLTNSASASSNANTTSFANRGYTIDYAITNSWGTTQEILVSVRNTGAESIENWILVFDDFGGNITNIWDAQISTTVSGVEYVRNMGYNSDIAPGAAVTFGYHLANAVSAPTSIHMRQRRLPTDSGYSVNIEIDQDWGTGFNGRIILENQSFLPIEWWELTIDTNFTIDGILNSWSTPTLEANDGVYKFKGTRQTNTHVIPANSSMVIGFTGTRTGTPRIQNTTLTEVVFNYCRYGGVVTAPTGGFANLINANAPGTNGRGVLDINVLDLIDGTPINANDVYGIEVETWGPNRENRQVFIDVNGVASPMFHGSGSYNAARIWAIMSHGDTPDNGGRTAQNVLRYMNIYGGNPKIANNIVPISPFVSEENPDRFDIRIRANDNHASLVTEVSLLGFESNVLGTIVYTALDGNGTWGMFDVRVTDCVCGGCTLHHESLINAPQFTRFIDINGNSVNTHTHRDGTIRRYGFDSANNFTAQRTVNDGIELSRHYEYENGNLSTMINSLGNVMQFEHDENGNITRVVAPSGGTVDYQHNEYSQLLEVLYHVSGLYCDTETISVEYSYEQENLSSIIWNSQIYSFQYDASGNLVSISLNGVTLVTYIYSDCGLITRRSYANGQFIDYCYDDKGRVVSIRYNDEHKPRFSFVYSDELLKVYNAVGEVVFCAVSNRISDEYSQQLPNEFEAFAEADYFERLARDGVVGIFSRVFNYISRSEITTSDFIENIEFVFNDTTQTLEYTYNVDGLITSVSNGSALIASYEYDEAGQLIRVNDAIQNRTFVYQYDAGGNIRFRFEHEFTIGEPGIVIDTISFSYDNSEWRDQLTNFNGQLITYDAVGNPLTIGECSFAWEFGRQLRGITLENGDEIHFTYDHSGIRTGKTIISGGVEIVTMFTNVNGIIVSEQKGGLDIFFHYDEFGNLIAMSYDDECGVQQIFFYVLNLQGDVIALFGFARKCCG
jgi:YD repeat-containing protein